LQCPELVFGIRARFVNVSISLKVAAVVPTAMVQMAVRDDRRYPSAAFHASPFWTFCAC
jgi:hypothetical protein